MTPSECPSYRKLHAEFDAEKRVWIKCPHCHKRQELPITEEWYSIEMDGKVYPMFVCMEHSRRCRYEAWIWIVNWK